MSQESYVFREDLLGTGFDHASLALMPFVPGREHNSTEPLTVTVQVPVDEKIRRVSYTMLPGPGVSLPSQTDQLVLLALLQQWLAGPETERLAFERRPLLQAIGWPTGGAGYRQLREALERLTRMVIRIESELVGRDGTAYREGVGDAHLLDRWWLGDDGRAWVVWGDLVTEARAIGDIKRLDWALLLRLQDPVARQLYRLVDRATLSGQTEWTVRWRTLAQLCGLSPDGYAKPAKLKQRLAPRLDQLVSEGVLERWQYERGGTFILSVRNYLRGRLRQSLLDAGVYPEAARQLVAGYDEVRIIGQLDALTFGLHGVVASAGGYLTEAIRRPFDLRYPEDDALKVAALLGMLPEPERQAFHAAALRLCGAGESLLATREDPGAWPTEFRAVVRWLVCQAVDPEAV